MFINEDILATIHQRAASYDLENRFPEDDFNDLKAIGYLGAFVPKEYGGSGLSLAEIAAQQTRLAMAAPATALAINMHHVIVGMARYMVKKGNMKGEQILKDAVAGKLLAFGISEPANDKVLFGSLSKAVTDSNGGYYFSGKKVFISMIQYCDRFVSFGQEDTEDGPKSVFAYLDNDPKTVKIDPNWNTLGMRATQSQNMELVKAYAPESRILTKVNPGPTFDAVVFGIFANFEVLLAATYLGIGKRAVELGIDITKTRKSISNDNTYDQDKDIRWRLADAAIAVDSIDLQIEGLANKFESDFDYGKYWMPKLSAVKNIAVEASKHAVEQVVRSAGGRGYYNDQELSRLLRDVYAGLFQPSDQESLHNAWAGILLGPIK